MRGFFQPSSEPVTLQGCVLFVAPDVYSSWGKAPWSRGRRQEEVCRCFQSESRREMRKENLPTTQACPRQINIMKGLWSLSSCLSHALMPCGRSLRIPRATFTSYEACNTIDWLDVACAGQWNIVEGWFRMDRLPRCSYMPRTPPRSHGVSREASIPRDTRDPPSWIDASLFLHSTDQVPNWDNRTLLVL